MKKLAGSILVAAILAVAVTFAVMALTATTATPAAAARCVCPKVYAPVECDRGKTYANQCLADCRNARNCVPTAP